jgi:hypothetical protein
MHAKGCTHIGAGDGIKQQHATQAFQRTATTTSARADTGMNAPKPHPIMGLPRCIAAFV